jgi:hypothetical protein
MAHYQPKAEGEEFVEDPVHGAPPPYQDVFLGPSSSGGGDGTTDAILRELRTMSFRMGKMEEKLESIRVNMAKGFIMDIIKTKEFTRSVAACIDSKTRKLDMNKFIDMVESPEPGGLAALIKKVMMDNGLTYRKLEEIVLEAMLTYEPEELPEEIKKKWSGFKIGTVTTLGVGTCLLALLAIFNPAVLGGIVIAGVAAGLCGVATVAAGCFMP